MSISYDLGRVVGRDYVILGYYDTLSELEQAVPEPNIGDIYGVGTEAPYNSYIYSSIKGAPPEWVDNGTVQGIKGDQGEAATIEVGNVTTGEPGTEVEIAERGTPQEKILDFTIPRGSPGHEVEFQVTETYIQWRHEGDATWNDLVALEDIKGNTGPVGPASTVPGPPGNDGEDGRGIVSIERTSGTGAAGTTDTYTITLTDSSTTSFYVYNGADGQGVGDMLKSTYDTDNSGVVDDAEKLGGQLPNYYAKADDIPTVPTSLADLSDDTTHRLVTDEEKETWSGKQDALGFTPASEDDLATVATAATNAQAAAEAAQETADDAATAAGSAQSTADDAATAAGNAQTTANQASTSAAAAASAASNAQSTADNAATAAAAAQTTANAKISSSEKGTANGIATLDANAKVTAAQASAEIVIVTANKTLALSDAGKWQKVNSSTARTITIPTNASVPFPIGTEIEVCQYGAGSVTIAAASGVTLRSEGDLFTIDSQNHVAILKKLDTNEWQIVGCTA